MTEWGWRSGFGRKSRGAEPDFWIVPEDGQGGTTWERRISAAERATALLPDQCPRCFECTTHADGCMIAANLARGVPAFWAPVVMPIAPPVAFGFALYLLRTDGALVWLNRAESADAWVLRAVLAGILIRPGEGVPNSLHVGFVALGPDGPTLDPWST